MKKRTDPQSHKLKELEGVTQESDPHEKPMIVDEGRRVKPRWRLLSTGLIC